jgi:hypothetical protein
MIAAGWASAYEVDTHEEMSQRSVQASILAKDNGIPQAIGLRELNDKQKFLNSKNNEHDIVNLFRDGARFEDDDSRP